MKKNLFLSLASAIIGTAMLTSCGAAGTGLGYTPQQQATTTSAPNGSDLLGAMANGLVGNNSILSNIISTFAPGITTNQSTIVGSWTYTKPCVQFESENLLAQAGGAVASAKVEEKLAQYYQIVGVKPGACTFVFGNNNVVQYTLGGTSYQGTYTFDSAKKTITITTQMGLRATAYVSVAGNNMALTFDANKLLSLAGNAAASMSGVVTALVGNYKGMKIGFAFAK